MDEFVAAEIESTPLIDRIDAGIHARLLEECREALAWFVANGRTAIPIEGRMIIGGKKERRRCGHIRDD
jgi:hypothetical protein